MILIGFGKKEMFMNDYKKKTPLNQNIYTFLLLFLTSSFVVARDIIPNSITISIWLTLMFAMLIKLQFRINKIQLYLFGTIMATILLSVMINGENIISGIKVLFSVFVGTIYISLFSVKSFIESYKRVMTFLCSVSLIGFLLYLLAPSLVRSLPIADGQYAYMGLFTVALGYYRNFGMFWEPGAFQVFITFALIFYVFGDDLDIKRLTVYVVSMITTFSTTGYFVLILLLLIYLFRHKKNRHENTGKFIILFIALLFFVLFSLNQELLFGTGGGAVFGKLQVFFRNRSMYATNQSQSSTSIRFYGVVLPIAAFFNRPLLGYGVDGLAKFTYDYTLGMNTCTFVNFFAVYGVMFGTIMFMGLIKFARIITAKKCVWIVLLLFFLATLSENLVNNAMMIMIALYGYKLQDGEYD